MLLENYPVISSKTCAARWPTGRHSQHKRCEGVDSTSRRGPGRAISNPTTASRPPMRSQKWEVGACTSALGANRQGRQDEMAGFPRSFIATARRMPESLSTFVSGRIVEAWGSERMRIRIPAIHSLFSGPVSLNRESARSPRRCRCVSLVQ